MHVTYKSQCSKIRKKVQFLKVTHCFWLLQTVKSKFFFSFSFEQSGSKSFCEKWRKKNSKYIVLAFDVIVQPHIIYCTVFSVFSLRWLWVNHARIWKFRRWGLYILELLPKSHWWIQTRESVSKKKYEIILASRLIVI